jgi:hypothetical protein
MLQYGRNLLINDFKEGSHYGTTPIMEVFWVLKSESILPNQIPERKKEKALSDLHIVGFLL